MDEEVRKWLKKKMEKIEAGESVLVKPVPDKSRPVSVVEKPDKEEEELVEKTIEREADVVEETVTEQEIEAKQEPELEQPVKEQPINTSVNVEEKIKEYLQERAADDVERPEEPKVSQQPQAEQELRPEQETRPEQTQSITRKPTSELQTKKPQADDFQELEESLRLEEPSQPTKEQKPKSKLFRMPKLGLLKILLPKPPDSRRVRSEDSLMGRLSRKPRFFTTKRILIAIISSIAGIVGGYFLLQLLSK